ncbi:MAG: putative glycoside hydrolase [Turneriella sp.]|nr:putative glycoside hydrolase [Leptospiraceae bacterium]MCX7633343.1 putative glycoside hydrolase [Turneriella sp.]
MKFMRGRGIVLAINSIFLAVFLSFSCHQATAQPEVITTPGEKAAVSDSNSKDKNLQQGAAANNPLDMATSPEEEKKQALLAIARPEFIRGIYLTNATAADSRRLARMVEMGKKYGLNTLVIDAQGTPLGFRQLARIKSAGFYPIARIVCFDFGLKLRQPEPQHLEKIFAAARRAAAIGFQEIQLDYIRYADEPAQRQLPLKFKYQQIAGVLEKARALADTLGVELGADVFGRITLNNDDPIGQKLEIFGRYVHNLYPMVYPSHYYGDLERIRNPYRTVKEGVEKSKERIPHTRIIPYIQGFAMQIKASGLSLPQYILKQFYAAEDGGADGFVVWNARNDYTATWQALREYERWAPLRKKPSKSLQAKTG